MYGNEIIPFLDLYRSNRKLVREVRAIVGEIAKSGSFILGSEVEAFETEYAKYLGGGAHVVGVGNGTDAIEIALRALEMPPLSEVLVPANSFIASAIGVLRAGLSVRFVDPDPETLLVDTNSFERALTAQTRAIMVVHLFGHVAPMEEVLAFAQKHGLLVVEDVAQAQGAKYKGDSVGVLGDAGATSFYPGKNLGAFGDAGAVISKSEEVAKRARLIRNLGSEKKYIHEAYGFNSRIDTLQAAVLRIKLRRLDAWNDERKSAAALYDSLLSRVKDVSRPKLVPETTPVFHLYPVLTEKRDALQAHLTRHGITTLIHYPYAISEQWGKFVGEFEFPSEMPVAQEASRRLLSLPLFPGITSTEIRKVVSTITNFFRI